MCFYLMLSAFCSNYRKLWQAQCSINRKIRCLDRKTRFLGRKTQFFDRNTGFLVNRKTRFINQFWKTGQQKNPGFHWETGIFVGKPVFFFNRETQFFGDKPSFSIKNLSFLIAKPVCLFVFLFLTKNLVFRSKNLFFVFSYKPSFSMKNWVFRSKNLVFQ